MIDGILDAAQQAYATAHQSRRPSRRVYLLPVASQLANDVVEASAGARRSRSDVEKAPSPVTRLLHIALPGQHVCTEPRLLRHAARRLLAVEAQQCDAPDEHAGSMLQYRTAAPEHVRVPTVQSVKSVLPR